MIKRGKGEREKNMKAGRIENKNKNKKMEWMRRGGKEIVELECDWCMIYSFIHLLSLFLNLAII